MSVSPLVMDQEIKEDAKGGGEDGKEEDWEVVDKSRENSMAAINMDSLDFDKIKDISEESLEKETEDWYKTIPGTPANTPEYRPTPPAYPSSSLRKPEVQKPSETSDLPPIKEDAAEEISQETHHDEKVATPKVEHTPENVDLEAPFSLKKTFVIASLAMFRLLLFVIVFSFVKWTLSKILQKIRSLRAKN